MRPLSSRKRITSSSSSRSSVRRRSVVLVPGATSFRATSLATSTSWAEPGIGLPCGQAPGSSSRIDQPVLDLGRDHAFPPFRFLVRLVPRKADDVDQQMFSEPVSSDQDDRHLAPPVGEPQRPAVGGEEPVGHQSFHVLGHRCPAHAHPPAQFRLHQREPLLLELEQGFQVVGRRVSRVRRHGRRLRYGP